MDSIISIGAMILITVASFAIVISVGTPLIEKSIDSVKFSETISLMKRMDNYVNEVSSEGAGSSRILKFRTDVKNFRVSSVDNSVEVDMATQANLIDYYSRSIDGNMLKVSGNDMECLNNSDTIKMQNSYISVVFRHTPTLASMNTATLIANITEKRTGRTIVFSDSSIVIDDNDATRYGLGYTELSSSGRALCRAHAYVNSTVNYDIYYTLYAGADFLDIEVRNIE